MKRLLLIGLLCSTSAFALTDEDKGIVSQSKEKVVQGAKTVASDFKKDDKLKDSIKESYQKKKEKLKSSFEQLKNDPIKKMIMKQYTLGKLRKKGG